MTTPAFDCAANDKLFGNKQAKPAGPVRTEPQRRDLRRAQHGELLIGLRKARALLEESEAYCLSSKSASFVSRLERLGDAISVALELERRLETALAKQNTKDGGK